MNFHPASSQLPLLVCFSHLRWNFVYQRPQHLITRAAKQFNVIFVEEPLHESVAAPGLRQELTPEGIRVLTPLIPISFTVKQSLSSQRLLLEDFLQTETRERVIFWYYTPTALAISYHLLPDAVIYDCMDELSLFKMAPPTLRELERHLFGRADVVFTGGHALFEAKRHYHHNIYEFPSSVDVGHFSKARSSKSSPQDAAHIKRPQIGFFGVIDERMDLELLAGMAAARRDWQFVMIGPVVKVDPGSLPDHDNIHWMGPRPYSALPDYIGSWDVGLMPFAINDATRFISPTKTLEFLAAGCPVVSTPITDVVTPYGVRGLVEIAATVGEALECTERLMLQEDRTQWLQAVDAYLAGRSWDATWAEMHAHIEKCLRHGRRRAVAQDLREAAYV